MVEMPNEFTIMTAHTALTTIHTLQTTLGTMPTREKVLATIESLTITGTQDTLWNLETSAMATLEIPRAFSEKEALTVGTWVVPATAGILQVPRAEPTE